MAKIYIIGKRYRPVHRQNTEDASLQAPSYFMNESGMVSAFHSVTDAVQAANAALPGLKWKLDADGGTASDSKYDYLIFSMDTADAERKVHIAPGTPTKQ